VGGAGDNVQPRLSPDGTRVLFSRPDEQTGNRDLWWMEISRGLISRLTTNQANDWAPVWSPDTHAILFGSDRAGGPGFAIYQKTSAELGSSETLLYQFPDPSISAHPTDWSRSGAWILFTKDFTLSRDLWTMPTGGDRTPVPLLESSFNQENARFSPDEKWIAYASNESGRYEVFVRPIAAGGMAGSGRIQVSTSGGDFPVWQRDGKELFFIGADLKLYSVDTADYQSPGAAPRPVALFAPCGDTILAGLPVRGTPWDHPYDVFPDGQRFLVNCATSDPSRFNVVLSWAESLK
jgi:Tol biopolymer transport system component